MTKEQIELIQKIRRKTYINDYIKNADYSLEPEVNLYAMHNGPVSKKKFMPSENERKKIKKIIHAMKMGWIKIKPPKIDVDPLQNFL